MTTKPFAIPKRLAWEAYQRVKANRGAAGVDAVSQAHRIPIVPLVHQSDLILDSGSQTGVGNVLKSLFFSPVAPIDGGWIWGVGAEVLPTGSDDLLTADKWAAGPTAVVL
jgi:hypothetical protein